jgi:hypothetical protein
MKAQEKIRLKRFLFLQVNEFILLMIENCSNFIFIKNYFPNPAQNYYVLTMTDIFFTILLKCWI